MHGVWAIAAVFAAGCGETGVAGPSDANADAGLGSELDGSSFASRCQIAPTEIVCDREVMLIDDSITDRDIAYQVPLGSPPATGWPAVVYYQGSFIPGAGAFSASVDASFGQYNLTLTIKALLDNGYAVIAPNATNAGNAFWGTNVPPSATFWAGTPDDVLVKSMLDAISAGAFGPIDANRLYAMGISSGGFMTSRMAISYPGVFRALANHSGSYATCSAFCFVPPSLPSNHPPMLFLHGNTDTIVPRSAVQPYLDALQSAGHEAQIVSDPDAGHEWLVTGPSDIPAWFASHP